MSRTGGCYCRQVRYASEGDPVMQAQCHCRECQYITGGSPNVFMVVPEAGFTVTAGETKSFARDDLDTPVTREFCPNCGTHILTRSPGLAGAVILKVGSLDDPSEFNPQMAIFTCDKQAFHTIADSLPSFERMPG